ncbi:hypothetical protein DDZ15_01355 [Rhodohalobacter mucosus]|uniref:Uncharacterized protein n=2 Tax=Rhodohalobacter mucosus TaxID=2079485 RepID=A0A316TWD8_9BACT|nr:hypothetical protein DDZ15_01355 [Rhodohalobacter mucosus]
MQGTKSVAPGKIYLLMIQIVSGFEPDFSGQKRCGSMDYSGRAGKLTFRKLTENTTIASNKRYGHLKKWSYGPEASEEPAKHCFATSKPLHSMSASIFSTNSTTLQGQTLCEATALGLSIRVAIFRVELRPRSLGGTREALLRNIKAIA